MSKKCAELLKRYEDNLTLIHSIERLVKQTNSSKLKKELNKLYGRKLRISDQLEDKCPNAVW